MASAAKGRGLQGTVKRAHARMLRLGGHDAATRVHHRVGTAGMKWEMTCSLPRP